MPVSVSIGTAIWGKRMPPMALPVVASRVTTAAGWGEVMICTDRRGPIDGLRNGNRVQRGDLSFIRLIVANLSVLAGIAPRLRGLLEDGRLDPTFIVRVIWGDFTSTVVFAAFVSLALLFRHRGEVHRRLMFLASTSIIGPALGRIALWPAFKEIHNLSFIVSVAPLVFFLGALVIYDLVRTKRIHPATLTGGAVRILVWLGTGAIAASDFGTRFVLRLA